MTSQRTSTLVLAEALFELARTIQGDDGIANAAIAEAAHRLREQHADINVLTVKLNADRSKK